MMGKSQSGTPTVKLITALETPVGLTIMVDHTGKVSITCSPGISVPTPLGTFSMKANVSFPNKKLLIIKAGDAQHVYDLGKEDKIDICIPNDKNNMSRLSIGKDQVTLTIPDPVWKSK
jgi:hypothetical protein